MAVAATGLLARVVPITNHAVLGAAALAPYLLIAAPAGALLLAAARRTVIAVVAMLVTIAGLLVVGPRFVGAAAEPAGDTAALRLLTVNLGLGLADADSLVAAANDSDTDIIAVQELTPEAAQRYSASGLDAAFPHRVLDARPTAAGIGLWSRYPIVDSTHISGFELAMLSVRIRVPGVAVDPTVLSAHISGPWPQPIDGWRAELKRMPETLSAVADTAGAGAVLIAGDFNATLDMAPFRALLECGYRDASTQSRAGLTRTFPANATNVPPLIGIDHVLTHQATATELRTVAIAGTDHLGLIATVHVPRLLGSPDSEPADAAMCSG